MKRIFSALSALVLISTFSMAQAKKGDLLVGATSSLNFGSTSSSIEYDGESSDIGKTTEFSFSPGVGYFVVDGLALGVDVNWETSISKPDEGDEVKTSQFLIGPFAKYYFGATNLKPFLESSFGFGSGNNDDQDYNLSGYSFGGGVAVFLNEVVSLEFGLGYGGTTAQMKDVQIDFYGNTDDVDVKTSGFGFEFGFSFAF